MITRKIMQKGMFVVLSFWLLALNIASSNRDYTYKITYASDSINHWETKNQVLEIYDTLTKRVDEGFHYEMISQGIQEFEAIKRSEASLKNNQISIVIGDGKGMVIEGTFQSQCKVEVKRKSLFLTLLGKDGN